MTKAFVGKYFSRWLSQLGRIIAKHPYLFLFGALIFTGIQSLGWLNFYHMQDFDYLFYIRQSRTESDRRKIEQLFPLNNSENIELGRVTQILRSAVVLVRAKDKGSIFRPEIVKEILRLDNDMYKISVEFNGQKWNFSTLCAKWWFGNCTSSNALEIMNRLDEFHRGIFKPTYPIDMNSFKGSFISVTAASLGGVETDANKHIISAKAIRFIFQLDFRKDSLKDINYAWEKKFLNEIQKMKFKYIELSLFTSLSVSDELTEVTINVLPLGGVAGFMVFSFSIFTCLSTNWVISKPWMGLAAGISAILCVLSSFGFVLMCGIPYIDIVLSIPFLMLGIGIDDSFVLIAAWRRTNPKDSVEDRMGKTFSEAAVSITLTSLTNFFSFCVGLATPFRMIQIYSIYAMTAIVFCYCYEITFFGACLALSGYREKKKLHPLSFQPVISKMEAVGKHRLYKLFCYGDDIDYKKESVWLMIFFRDYFSILLIKKYSRSIILLLLCMYLGIAAYGCYSIKEGMDYRHVFQYDSYGWKYMDWHYKYFTQYPHRIQIVINKTLDYSNPVIQQKVENLLQTFENSSFCSGQELTESWLRLYKNAVNSPQGWLSFRGYNMSNKKDFIDGLKIFFKIKLFEMLSSDVIFNENETDIVASRFIINSKDVHNSAHEKIMLNQLYEIAEKSEFPVIVYSLLFPIIEQLLYIRSICIQTIASASVIMVITFFAFVPNIKCAFFVALSIIFIEVGVIGLMSYWNVNLDALALMSLIMCVGFSVDFISHVSYAYVACKDTKSIDKIRYSLFAAGMPIVQGATSTILGIFILIFARSYSYIIFFKVIFIVMILASLNALFILPILLSFVDKFNAFSDNSKDQNTVETEKLNTTKKNEL